jgi:hypothetical protein
MAISYKPKYVEKYKEFAIFSQNYPAGFYHVEVACFESSTKTIFVITYKT